MCVCVHVCVQDRDTLIKGIETAGHVSLSSSRGPLLKSVQGGDIQHNDTMQSTYTHTFIKLSNNHLVLQIRLEAISVYMYLGLKPIE